MHARSRSIVTVLIVFGFALTIALSAPGSASAGDLVISELMAINDSFRDQDGDTPDFVEIFNAGNEPCDMDGWFLTDDALNLAKWGFPAVTIPPGGFLVVWCSDKNRRDPNSELHADFKLNGDGEYCALVEPGGETVHFEFAPYPAQAPGFSYGLSQNSTHTPLLTGESPCRVLVPTKGNLGTDWTERDFNDSSWRSGTAGVGYDTASTYDSLIKTDVQGDMSGQRTGCYIRFPFDVDDPTGLGAMTMQIKYDDGFVAYINGVEVARGNMTGFVSWDSASSAQNDDSRAVVFEQFDIIVPPGTLVAGENVLAIHGLNRSTGSSDFLIFPELESTTIGELDRNDVLFFPDPTPGSGNLPGVVGLTAPPEIIPSGRVISARTAISISSESEAADVYYTTDGSVPTTSSTLYTAPFNISSSAWVRARAFEPDGSVSPIVSESYIFLASNVRNFRSDLPVIVIDNNGRGRPGGGTFQGAFMAIYEPGEDGRTSFSEAPALAQRFGIKTRGSSTGGRDKASYTLEFWDENDEDDNSVKPLGMPAEADWVLYGAYNFDRIHLRNPMIYQISRECGRWASRTRHVEVYFNMGGGALDSGDYRGIYSFMDKVTRGRNRVDVEELDSGDTQMPEISGGYMLKIDRADPGDSGFGAAGQSIKYNDPKESEISSAQRTWLTNYFNQFGSALNGGNFRDPVNGYRRYIDPESWVDHHLLNVLTKNADALRLSTHFYKDREGLIEYGPIWDFDRSMDSTDGRDNNPTGWDGGTNYFGYPWWGRLFDDPDFMQLYRDRWNMFRTDFLSNAKGGENPLPPVSNSNISLVMNTMANNIQNAVPRDSAKWNQISAAGFRPEVNRIINWLHTRANWMDSQFRTPPRFSPNGGAINPGRTVTMSATTGTVYYTLDGGDPRARGGGIAAGATRYTGSIQLDETTLITARARVNNNDWSPPTVRTFYTSLPTLVVSEVHYHPEQPPADSSFEDENFEFIEFVNTGDSPLSLAGVRIRGAIEFTFDPNVEVLLEPGEYVVLVQDIQAFAERYDVERIFVAGEYSGRLENGGERVVVEGPLGEPIHNFLYQDTWYPTTDGGGDSLNIIDLLASSNTWNRSGSWSPSTVSGGTPGAGDPGLPGLVSRQTPGDSNQDGSINISDAFWLVRRLFLGVGGDLPCAGADLDSGDNLIIFDNDGSGEVNVTDVIYLLAYLYQGGPGPTRGTECIAAPDCETNCR